MSKIQKISQGICELRILDDIRLEYDVGEIIRFCHLNRISNKIGDVKEIIEEGYSLIDPKAIYRISKIELKDDRLILEKEKVLTSKLLAEKFKCTPEAAVYVITIGPNLEKRVAELGVHDLYRAFIIDNVGTYALRQTFDLLKKDFKPNSPERISKFSPGSTTHWNIEQQKVIFDFLGIEKVRRATGVILNNYYVMIPRKSVSGVMGDTTTQFHECQICSRNCEYRKVPFTG